MNTDLLKKYSELHRQIKVIDKLIIVLEAVKKNVANTSQYNFEGNSKYGKVFAIKIDQHRFYTIDTSKAGYRILYICRYEKKESQKNTKKIKQSIEAIDKIEINLIELWK